MARRFPTKDEIDAKNICCTYLGYNKNTLNLSDLPDLQDLTNDVGIEVRNVFDPVAGKIKAYLEKNFNTQKTLKEKVEELKKIHIDGEIIDLGFVDARLKNVHEYKQHLVDTFGDAYEDKLSKLNGGNYQIFNENDLFLFCVGFNKAEIMDALDTLKQKKLENTYLMLTILKAFMHMLLRTSMLLIQILVS